MNKIKSKMHMGNKHFVWGLSFVIFSLVASIVWGFIYAEDTTSILSTIIPTIDTTAEALITTTNSGDGGGSSCTGLDLILSDGKTTYTVGDMVNYSWSCSPSGTTGNVSVWLQKPDGSIMSYGSGSGSNSAVIGFGTSNLVPGQYILKACLGSGSNCTTSGTTIATQIFNVVSTTSGGGYGTTATTAPSGFEPYTTLTSSMTVIPLKWIDNSNNETSFVIEKKLNTVGTYALLSSVGANTTHYTDSYSIVKDVLYDYRIKACSSTSSCSDYVYLLGVKIPPTTSVGTNSNGSSTCTGLNLDLNDGKTTYTVGQSVNYTWTCNPTGSTGTVSIWLNKPDGSMTNFNTTVGSNTQTLGFSTSNLAPGQYVLKACLGTSCSTYGGIITAQVFNVVSSTTVPSTTPYTAPTNSSTPLAPSSLRLDGIVIPYKISLSWNDNSNNEDKFVIEKKLSSASVWSSLTQVGTNILHYVDTKVIPNTAYDYRITACLSGIGCSSYYTLDKVYTTTETTKPVAPITPTTPTAPIMSTTSTAPVEPVITKIPTITPTTTTTTDTTKALFPTKSLTEVMPTNPNIEVASSSAEIKVPTPLEIPKDIIESVTTALNIIRITPPEVKTDVNQTEQVKEQIKQEEIAKQETAQQEITKLVYQDTNKDGISDYDSKYVYNIDPVKPSPTSTYEGKSVNAGEKILLGFDPGKKELAKVTVEEPTTSKTEAVVASYKVREVALTEKKEVKLKGQAMPNSFITLYIYSTPIMVTVKTDSNGEWQYTLDKELENGNHTVYTATVNNTGNIVAKSTPFTFVKTAEAVTLQDIAPIKSINIPTTTVERPGFLQTKNVLMIGIAFFMILGITFIFIGLLSKKKNENPA